MTPSGRLFEYSAITAMTFAVVSILAIDGPLAATLSALPSDARKVITEFVTACELLFGFRVSVYFYGGMLILAGAAARMMRRPTAARGLLFAGLTHVTARFLADILKAPFSRLRPYEVLGGEGLHDTWFASVGNSFPSGHAVHFWSLFFPLAVLFPRLKLALAILPVLVSLARVAVNDHYLSDVIASMGLAALVAWVYARTILASPSRGTP
jgi:membrane-associated phospholipid phosphatase